MQNKPKKLGELGKEIATGITYKALDMRDAMTTVAPLDGFKPTSDVRKIDYDDDLPSEFLLTESQRVQLINQYPNLNLKTDFNSISENIKVELSNLDECYKVFEILCSESMKSNEIFIYDLIQIISKTYSKISFQLETIIQIIDPSFSQESLHKSYIKSQENFKYDEKEYLESAQNFERVSISYQNELLHRLDLVKLDNNVKIDIKVLKEALDFIYKLRLLNQKQKFFNTYPKATETYKQIEDNKKNEVSAAIKVLDDSSSMAKNKSVVSRTPPTQLEILLEQIQKNQNTVLEPKIFDTLTANLKDKLKDFLTKK
jgi:hypothetical protein